MEDLEEIAGSWAASGPYAPPLALLGAPVPRSSGRERNDGHGPKDTNSRAGQLSRAQDSLLLHARPPPPHDLGQPRPR